ncbi:Hypothetical predicted protein [Octopus vulgaris]|uniref:Uncharacterized protein n=1 Tax=Octopus vulgaris TaxID=6645 RepID=A0AA36B3P2_OCTVU|nr:Hypothetical predicted protein [Octopus vulgaris]
MAQQLLVSELLKFLIGPGDVAVTTGVAEATISAVVMGVSQRHHLRYNRRKLTDIESHKTGKTNKWVVPHDEALLRAFRCHCNVEIVAYVSLKISHRNIIYDKFLGLIFVEEQRPLSMHNSFDTIMTCMTILSGEAERDNAKRFRNQKVQFDVVKLNELKVEFVANTIQSTNYKATAIELKALRQKPSESELQLYLKNNKYYKRKANQTYRSQV